GGKYISQSERNLSIYLQHAKQIQSANLIKGDTKNQQKDYQRNDPPEGLLGWALIYRHSHTS
ncbi:MAG: hypothetical protein ACE5K8_08670, partial [Candidatus Zixiibacteriota bacterium]